MVPITALPTTQAGFQQIYPVDLRAIVFDLFHGRGHLHRYNPLQLHWHRPESRHKEYTNHIQLHGVFQTTTAAPKAESCHPDAEGYPQPHREPW